MIFWRQQINNKKLSKFNRTINRTGFSLVEISVVLIVIGILVVGVSQGYNLVRSAQISNARGITAKSPVGQISGLIAWYESSLLDSFDKNEIFDGAQITKWKDISSNSYLSGLNILTATASSNLTYQRSAINKIPGVKFSNTSSKINLSSFSQGATSSSTIFLVFKLNYTPNATNFVTLFDNGFNSPYSISIKSNAVKLDNGATFTQTSSNLFSLGKECIIAVYFNGSNSQIYLNDTNNKLVSVFSVNGTNQLNGLTVGNNYAGNLGFSGLIPEVIVFNRVIKESERKEIFYYLSKKYKISVNGI